MSTSPPPGTEVDNQPRPDPRATLLVQRVRVLAYLTPIIDLERDKVLGRAGRGTWHVYDTSWGSPDHRWSASVR